MNGYIIITEAIFDKHTLGEQTLASGGAALTPDQLIKIRILNPKKGIILAPDSDAAGIKSIIQNYHLLASLNFPIFYSIPPASEADKTDWNELYEKHGHTKSQIRNIFEKNIKKISISEIIKLSELISSKKRIRS